MNTNWKTRSFAFATIAALIFIAAMVAASQGPLGGGRPEPRGGFPGGPLGRGFGDGLGPLARDLNLTDEQKTQIQKITESFETSTKELRNQLRALHDNQPDPLTTTFDEATFRAAAEQQAKIEVELQMARGKMLSQIGAILTTEQKNQLAARGPRFRPGPPPEPPGE
jgi:Spy/CpxP family protein refolding chaperone